MIRASLAGAIVLGSIGAVGGSAGAITDMTMSNGEATAGGTSERVAVAAGAPSAVPLVNYTTIGEDYIDFSFAYQNWDIVYTYSLDSGATWLPFVNARAMKSVGGLTRGTQYSIIVRGSNPDGDGPSSEPLVFTPAAIPDAPSSVVVASGDGQGFVSFAQVSDGGSSIIKYMYTTDDSTWRDVSPIGTATSFTVSGLTNGREYLMKIRAYNAIGESSQSSLVRFRPGIVPTQPTSLSATSGDGQASISFTAGTANGSHISGYSYSSDDGVTWNAVSVSAVTSPVVITGLTNGTPYTLKIRPQNGNIAGPESEAITVTPLAAPASPTSLIASAGNGQVSIAFSAGSNNGSAITGYEYSVNNGASWMAASPAITSSPLVIAGLANGTQYSLKIRGVNAIGGGMASTAVTFTPVAPVTTTSTTIVSNNRAVESNTTPAPKEDVVLDLPTPTKALIADTSLTTGAPVTLTFGGFVPREFVQLIVASTPRVIASGYADSRGFITLTGDIPAALASGKHSLALFAPVSGIGIRQPITVAKAVDTLPSTGSSMMSALLSLSIVMFASAKILRRYVRQK